MRNSRYLCDNSALMPWNGIQPIFAHYCTFDFCIDLSVALKKKVPAFTPSVHEITQKVQKLLKKCKKFFVLFRKNHAVSRNFLLPAVATVATNITSSKTGRQRTFMAPIAPWKATTQAEAINPATNNRQDELIGTHWVWPCFQSSHDQPRRSHPLGFSPQKSHEGTYSIYIIQAMGTGITRIMH